MSEQVQLCEGVWLTRDGREIAIRARDFGDSEPTPWCWCSESTGEFETWRNDGWNTFSYRYHKQPLDLVEYVGPLPGAEPEPEPEPQPVEICEGVWKTRDGQLVEVVKSDNTAPARYQWAGLLLGVNESWRDDGRWSVKNEANHRDLVTYVGPLPEHTLSDTLAEIEEQPSEPEPDGETWKALAIRHEAACQMMEAKQDHLRGQLETMTAERDRLQAELQQARIDLEAERQVPRSEIAISDAAFAGFNRGKAWAFREVCDWLRPFVGANPEDAAALLDAVPGLVKRLAQCEGVEI